MPARTSTQTVADHGYVQRDQRNLDESAAPRFKHDGSNHLDTFFRVWRDTLDDTFSGGMRLTSELAKSRSPVEALSAYTTWVEGRTKRAIANGEAAVQLWRASLRSVPFNFEPAAGTGSDGAQATRR